MRAMDTQVLIIGGGPVGLTLAIDLGKRGVRATLIEGISRYHGGAHLAAHYHQLAKRRGRNKARVALARKVLTLAYYGLRDGEIRCLAHADAA